METSISHSTPYQPSPASHAFRTNLAGLISPLRRVRPRVPFWHLAAHRIPTLWGLYRGLLREAPDGVIRQRMRELIRKNRHLTGTVKTVKALELGYKFQTYFTLSHSSPHHAALLARYSSLLTHRLEKRQWAALALSEPLLNPRHPSHLPQNKLPIFTGGILRSSLYLPAMPRMKPQPKEISGIYRNRMERRRRRVERVEALQEGLWMLQEEARGEEELRRECVEKGWGYEPVYCEETQAYPQVKKGRKLGRAPSPLHPAWSTPFRESIWLIRSLIGRDHIRKATPPSPELLETVKAARRNKIVNKTRELERERRGEVLERTRRRARTGAPAHVWERWSEERKRMEVVARSSVSESGYVGMIKQRLGWRLRDPDAPRKEEGKGGEEVERLAQEVTEEGERRNRVFEEELKADGK